MNAPIVSGSSFRSLRADLSSVHGALRFRQSPETSGPAHQALQGRFAPPPEPDDGFRQGTPDPETTPCTSSVRGVFIFGEKQ